MAKGKFDVKQLKMFTDPKVTKGWKWVFNAIKAHYFLDGESLCGKWLIFSLVDIDDTNHDSQDNCARCKKLRNDLEIAKSLFIDKK